MSVNFSIFIRTAIWHWNLYVAIKHTCNCVGKMKRINGRLCWIRNAIKLLSFIQITGFRKTIKIMLVNLFLMTCNYVRTASLKTLQWRTEHVAVHPGSLNHEMKVLTLDAWHVWFGWILCESVSWSSENMALITPTGYNSINFLAWLWAGRFMNLSTC